MPVPASFWWIHSSYLPLFMFHVYQLFSTSALFFDSVIVFYFNNYFYRPNHQSTLLIFICIEHFFNYRNKYFIHRCIVFHYKIAYSTLLLFWMFYFSIWKIYFYNWFFVKCDKKITSDPAYFAKPDADNLFSNIQFT